MKWFERFLQKISDLVPLGDSRATALAIAKLNPNHIEVENVRSILNVSALTARRVCETAVRRGIFLPRIAILCPDDAVAKVVADRESMPEKVPCWIDDGDGPVRQDISTESLETREFYVLNDR
jgi:hypothetical protein